MMKRIGGWAEDLRVSRQSVTLTRLEGQRTNRVG